MTTYYVMDITSANVIGKYDSKEKAVESAQSYTEGGWPSVAFHWLEWGEKEELVEDWGPPEVKP